MEAFEYFFMPDIQYIKTRVEVYSKDKSFVYELGHVVTHVLCCKSYTFITFYVGQNNGLLQYDLIYNSQFKFGKHKFIPNLYFSGVFCFSLLVKCFFGFRSPRRGYARS